MVTITVVSDDRALGGLDAQALAAMIDGAHRTAELGGEDFHRTALISAP